MDSGVKNKAIIGIITITLVLTLANSYALFQLTGKAVSATGTNPGSGGINETQPIQNPGQPTVVKVSTGGNVALGNANASVTIVEFSDFECPYCGNFFTETLPLITKNYIDTGKVQLFFRDFPLSFHADAEKAAEAAECAGEQNKFWQMHDKLFENQNALGVDNLKQYAKDIGLDSAQFNSCLDSGKTAPEVQKDLADGQSYGVSGTPTFFINGVEVVGAQPYSAFEQVINQALSQ